MALEIDVAQVDRGVTALLEFVKKQSQTDLLQENQPVRLLLGVKKIPKLSNKICKVPLPHSLYEQTHGVCLFVKDLEENRADYEETERHYKELLATKGITAVTEVIPLTCVKKEYQPYEAKRNLANMYDVHLADERIVRLLPGFLGKSFYGHKKHPVQVNMAAQDLKAELQKALDTGRCIMAGRGSSCEMKVGRTDMSAAALAENVTAAMNALADSLPGGAANVRSFHLQTTDSPSLPVFLNYESASGVKLPKQEKRAPDEAEDVTPVTEGKVTVSRKGKITVIPEADAEETDAAKTAAQKAAQKAGSKLKAKKEKKEALIQKTKQMLKREKKKGKAAKKKQKQKAKRQEESKTEAGAADKENNDEDKPAGKQEKKEETKKELNKAKIRKLEEKLQKLEGDKSAVKGKTKQGNKVKAMAELQVGKQRKMATKMEKLKARRQRRKANQKSKQEAKAPKKAVNPKKRKQSDTEPEGAEGGAATPAKKAKADKTPTKKAKGEATTEAVTPKSVKTPKGKTPKGKTPKGKVTKENGEESAPVNSIPAAKKQKTSPKAVKTPKTKVAAEEAAPVTPKSARKKTMAKATTPRTPRPARTPKAKSMTPKA